MKNRYNIDRKVQMHVFLDCFALLCVSASGKAVHECPQRIIPWTQLQRYQAPYKHDCWLLCLDLCQHAHASASLVQNGLRRTCVEVMMRAYTTGPKAV